MERGKSRDGQPLCDPSYASSQSDSESSDSDVDDESDLREKQSKDDRSSANSKSLAPSFSMTMKSTSLGNETETSKVLKFSGAKSSGAFKMSMPAQNNKSSESRRLTANIANVFNEDETDVAEEMPPEAKMRMRNLGKGTPTATGPNSFAKGKLGFCNTHKIRQRELEKGPDEPQTKKKKF